jgi:hypothetical protein
VIHNSIRETWDNFGLVGFTSDRHYKIIGHTAAWYKKQCPSASQTASYSIRRPWSHQAPADSINSSALPLNYTILPTEAPKTTHPKPSYSKRCNYSGNSSPKTHNAAVAPTIPATSSARHRPSSDTGLDICQNPDSTLTARTWPK